MFLNVYDKIRELNSKLGINTIFIDKNYCLGNTIYLDKNSVDIYKNNMHELLHFYTSSSTFKMIKASLNIDDNIRRDYEDRYMKLYGENNDAIEEEIVIDYILDNYEIKYDNGLVIDNTPLDKKKIYSQ